MTNEKYNHKIDDLGRVLLPKELRSTLGWEIGDTLSLCRVSDTIVLSLEENEMDSAKAGEIAEGESIS